MAEFGVSLMHIEVPEPQYLDGLEFRRASSRSWSHHFFRVPTSLQRALDAEPVKEVRQICEFSQHMSQGRQVPPSVWSNCIISSTFRMFMNYIDTNITVTMWIRCQLLGGEDGQRTFNYSWTVNGGRWMCVVCFVARCTLACLPYRLLLHRCHTGVVLFPYLPGVCSAHTPK